MFNHTNLSSKNVICWCLFLVPALLLSTPNFSVGVIAFSVIISTFYLLSNKNEIKLDKFDYLVMFSLSFYFFGAIPIAIYDGTTARYFQGGARLLLCIPIYVSLSHYLKIKKVNLREHLELGVIFGSASAFILAIYQFYYLEMGRVDGFLFSINFGYLACSLAFLAFTLTFSSNKKALLLTAFILGVFSVTLTLTRGAIFAIPILLILVTALKFKSLSFKHILTCASIFVIASIATYHYSSDFRQRIDFTISEFSHISSGDINNALSSGDRIQFWFAATQAFKVSPLIGLPYKEREHLNQKLHSEGKMGERASRINRGHAHSQYFEMLASNGLLGIISILAIFVFPFVLLASHYIKSSSEWAFSGTVFVAGFMIFGLTEVPLTANLIGSFYGFMLAVFFAIIASEKHNKSVH
ncbi:O-antigen ligase [Vibrio tubiashii]|uniref:Ligase n=1 Tax=Vibrio tubiashii ATCC 19109 TaxID=1051646 RepID=F9T0F3_9VIBR|nr:O-antigen ligase family protein [Vibrio tubiashii]AIW12738.1 ligase [Vibrio tubiashii ATCC 19109]EGU58713.1 hypothetical protein VITU9109_12992 [Vibrio tubiashii ATCC 19109]EIF03086.1 hypothetical protein VT1337_15274 [Vibrio tubiashii NCIMB 1337 = ATCC 19106]